MKIRLCITFILVFAIIDIMSGCGSYTSEKETLFEELDVDYTTNGNGTYTCRNNIYQYKIEVSGIEGESQVTFIVLTNDTGISLEDITYSLKKAEMSTEAPEFVVLGWY